MSEAKNSRARERAHISPEVVGVRLAAGSRRTPLALVDVRVGPAVLTYGYALLRRNRWEVRPPLDAEGKPAVALHPSTAAKLRRVVQDAAEASEVVKGMRRGW